MNQEQAYLYGGDKKNLSNYNKNNNKIYTRPSIPPGTTSVGKKEAISAFFCSVYNDGCGVEIRESQDLICAPFFAEGNHVSGSFLLSPEMLSHEKKSEFSLLAP